MNLKRTHRALNRFDWKLKPILGLVAVLQVYPLSGERRPVPWSRYRHFLFRSRLCGLNDSLEGQPLIWLRFRKHVTIIGPSESRLIQKNQSTSNRIHVRR